MLGRLCAHGFPHAAIMPMDEFWAIRFLGAKATLSRPALGHVRLRITALLELNLVVS